MKGEIKQMYSEKLTLAEAYFLLKHMAGIVDDARDTERPLIRINAKGTEFVGCDEYGYAIWAKEKDN